MSLHHLSVKPETQWAAAGITSGKTTQNEGRLIADGRSEARACEIKKESHENTSNVEVPMATESNSDGPVKAEETTGKPIRVAVPGSHRRWACPECGKPSWSPAHLRVHMRVHTDERPACCHVCGARFRTHGNLARHLRAHAGDRPFACHHCQRRFSQKSVLIKHIRIHTGETPYSCNICHKQFSRSFTLACHRRVHGDLLKDQKLQRPPLLPEKWTCEVCYKVFKNNSYRHAHMQTHSKQFQCQECDKKFTSEAGLLKHVNVHSEGARKCSVCGKQLKTQANLARHMLVHTGERPFACSHCSQRFTQKSVLVKHERIHTGEMPYKCEVCLKKFSRSFTLENHLRRVHKKGVNEQKVKCETKAFWCENCDNWFSSDEFYVHECGKAEKFNLGQPGTDNSDDADKRNSPSMDIKEEFNIDASPENEEIIDLKRVESEIKDELEADYFDAFDNSITNDTDKSITNEAIENLITNHDINKPINEFKADEEIKVKARTKWQCKLCNEAFENKSEYKIHVQVHATKGYCEICKKHFNTNGNLIRHMLTHSGEKPFACEFCSKRFTQKGVLVKHERIHTGEMPYSCDVCHKKFARSFTLLNHKKVHNTVKPFSCQYCPKTFTQRSALMIHERNHTGERPFGCKICDKQFTSNSTLKSHSRIHTGLKQFLCEICNKQFTSSSNFYSHMRIHRGDKKHTCDVCQKKFYTNSSLTKHKRVHTNKVCKVEAAQAQEEDPSKQYACSVCRRRFSSCYLLERHERTHTGEKPYPCEDCDKKFALRGDLTRHRRGHSGEKRYACARCHKQFTRGSALKHHRTLHQQYRRLIWFVEVSKHRVNATGPYQPPVPVTQRTEKTDYISLKVTEDYFMPYLGASNGSSKGNWAYSKNPDVFPVPTVPGAPGNPFPPEVNNAYCTDYYKRLGPLCGAAYYTNTFNFIWKNFKNWCEMENWNWVSTYQRGEEKTGGYFVQYMGNCINYDQFYPSNWENQDGAWRSLSAYKLVSEAEIADAEVVVARNYVKQSTVYNLNGLMT